MSTTIPLHQIGTGWTTPGILASDRNCLFRQRSCTNLNASAVGIRLVACDTSNEPGMLISECHCGMCLLCLAASCQKCSSQMEGRRCIELFRFVTPMSRSRVIAPIRAVCAAGTAHRALPFACRAASGPTFLCIDCPSDSVGIVNTMVILNGRKSCSGPCYGTAPEQGNSCYKRCSGARI